MDLGEYGLYDHTIWVLHAENCWTAGCQGEQATFPHRSSSESSRTDFFKKVKLINYATSECFERVQTTGREFAAESFLKHVNN